ncbi:MAG TPA: aminoglycoside 3'-phosphotransferase [Galbitalea sp.]|jgi:kanamycin kinase|nr:aminoglycoside 3'-phosphotransferase [Galbitalea sp.]
MSKTPLASVPTDPVDIPVVVASLAGPDTITPVWRNELGGLTFRLTAASGTTRYVKWTPAGTPEIDLAAEASRLDWASRWIAVPRVLESGLDASGAWLVTAGIDATSAIDPRWIAEPVTAVRAIGRGLRILHDSLPVAECSFDWSIETRLANVDARIASGLAPPNWRSDDGSLSLADARARLEHPPAIDRLVVCHGDACAPNTLLDASGGFAAQVDLGALGVGDPWADIAVAAWSTQWNYGPGFTGLLYESYGVDPDPERIEYYRLLWDLG